MKIERKSKLDTYAMHQLDPGTVVETPIGSIAIVVKFSGERCLVNLETGHAFDPACDADRFTPVEAKLVIE
jgi:hypothetical protein